MKNTLIFGVFLAVMVCIGTIAGCALTNAMTGESPVAIVMRWQAEDAGENSEPKKMSDKNTPANSGEAKNDTEPNGKTQPTSDANISEPAAENVNLRSLESAISDAIPQEYKSEKWFDVSCDELADEGISVIVQIDRGSGDSDAALAAAVQCFEISKTIVENSGATFATISVIVVNNGAPVGIFSTQDGKNFTSISDGKMAEISLPQDGN